jgi:hypothetical protein
MKELRIIKINPDDILEDYRAVSDMINTACSRSVNMKVKSCFKINHEIVVVLEEDPCKEYESYVFSPLRSPNTEEIIAEINSRFCSGFSTIGILEIKSTPWGLFALSQKNG